MERFESTFGCVAMIVVTALSIVALVAGADWVGSFAHSSGMRNLAIAGYIFVLVMFSRGGAGLIITVTGFLGMYNLWGWPMWKAAVVAAPGLVLMALTLMVGFGSIFARRKARPDTPVE